MNLDENYRESLVSGTNVQVVCLAQFARQVLHFRECVSKWSAFGNTVPQGTCGSAKTFLLPTLAYVEIAHVRT